MRYNRESLRDIVHKWVEMTTSEEIKRNVYEWTERKTRRMSARKIQKGGGF